MATFSHSYGTVYGLRIVATCRLSVTPGVPLLPLRRELEATVLWLRLTVVAPGTALGVASDQNLPSFLDDKYTRVGGWVCLTLRCSSPADHPVH